MSAATKAQAQVKLAAITAKVGYPDKWKDYSALLIGRNSYCENMMNAARWRFQDELGKYGKPVDRSEWDMTPQTYNAYYNPSNNEIVLPAAAFTIPGVPDSRDRRRGGLRLRGRVHRSAMKSPTASMIPAGSTTPRATCMTGGRPRTRDSSSSAPRCWRTSSMPTSHCPGCTSTARRASARTSPTTAACCSASMHSARPNSTGVARASMV